MSDATVITNQRLTSRSRVAVVAVEHKCQPRTLLLTVFHLMDRIRLIDPIGIISTGVSFRLGACSALTWNARNENKSAVVFDGLSFTTVFLIMPLPRDLFADWVAFQASSSEIVIFSSSASQFVVVAWFVVISQHFC
jgi:hypothetical protein